MTIMFAATAEGVLLPPFFIFKAVDVYKNWLRNAPAGSGFDATPSGWMTARVMKKWLDQIVVPYADSLKNNMVRVVVLDNFK
jgi:hypothetical protein